MTHKGATQWVAAVIGGLIIFFVVYGVSYRFLCRFGERHPILEPVFAIGMPGLLGLLAGIHVVRRSIRRDNVRSFRLWRDPDYRPFGPGHCQKCGYNLTGNVSGVCPECGEAVGRG